MDRGITSNVIYKGTLIDKAEAAVTASRAIECAGAKAVMLSLTAADVNAREMTLSVTVSHDGTTFHTYNMLIDNVTNAIGENLTRIKAKQRTADGTDLLWFTPETLGGITHFKVALALDTAGNDGIFTVKYSVIF